MAQVINTNTMSLNAQRNLSTSGSSLATTIQRLSSGSRINSAKDDAAGLAISERFGTQIRGTDVAIRNANDGISLAQVAEGSLSEIGNNLQRVRELAVQSSNATNSASDRKALQAEVTQLVNEIDRVAKQSEFNGTKLLDGSFSSQLFQVGANAGQAIAIDKVVNAKADSIGQSSFASDGKLEMGAAAALVSGEIKGLTIGSVALSDISFEQGTSAVTADAEKQTVQNALNATVTAINAKLGETGVYAAQAVDASGVAIAGEITLTSIKSDLDSDGVAALAVTGGGASVTVDADIGEGDDGAQQLKNVDITNVIGAQRALEIVDNALGAINNTRADLGAIQNRFTSVVANLQTSTENLSASRSRIKDTDFAKETAELTRTQILQQAGTAMLAQANQVPQNVLSLLR